MSSAKLLCRIVLCLAHAPVRCGREKARKASMDSGLSPVTTLASCETLTLILRHRLASLLLVQASNAAGI